MRKVIHSFGRFEWAVWWAQYRLDLLASLGLLLLALAVRAPSLYLVPRFTDEMIETDAALQIALGARNLFASDPYLGPLLPSLLGLILHFWANPYVPRAFVMVASALTVPAAYLLGRILHGRAAGVIAALLMATSSAHIVVNSHIAYSSSLPPLLMTLSLASVILARREDSARWLVLGGAFFGLAAQTHPVSLAALPGLVTWFLLKQPFARQASPWRWLRQPGLYAAMVTCLLVYSPVLIGLFSLRAELEFAVVSRSYALATDHSLLAYLANWQNMGVELARMLGAVFYDLGRPRNYLSQPLVFAYAVLVPLALLAALLHRGRERAVLPLVLASSMALIAYFNQQYAAYPFFTRYVAYLLPILYTAVAMFGIDLALRARRALSHRPIVYRWAAGAAGLLALAFLAAWPLKLTFDYYAQQISTGRSNTLMLDIAERIASQPATVLYLDEELQKAEVPSGGTFYLSYWGWFRVARRPFENLRPGALAERCRDDARSRAATGLTVGRAPILVIATEGVANQLARACRVSLIVGAQLPTRPGFGDVTHGLYQIDTQ